MARLDYTCAYSKLPAKPSPAYPNQSHVLVPLVELGLANKAKNKGLRVNALLDTGAGINLFRSDYADALRIDWKAAPTMPIIGIGSELTGHVVTLRIGLPDAKYWWNAPIVFTDGMIMLQPLIGHLGFLEHFEVRFNKQKTFRIFLK